MLSHSLALPKGYLLRQYKTLDVLGLGGFGITYRAYDPDLDEEVAIKEYLPSDLAERQGDSTVSAKSELLQKDFEWGLSRFLDEARALAKFKHNHIVRVKQFFKQNSTGYMVMDYEKGETLEAVLNRLTSLDEKATKEILLPILNGLKLVHEQGFLHRDIKPSNIIIREKEKTPVLIDFGAARQAIGPKSRTVTAVLTPGYAPLEQYSPDDNQGPWTDIYALGAVAYKCLTGEKPPDATVRVRKDSLVPLLVAAKNKVSGDFAEAIEWALKIQETGRPQSVEEFVAALSPAGEHEPGVPKTGNGLETAVKTNGSGPPSVPVRAREVSRGPAPGTSRDSVGVAPQPDDSDAETVIGAIAANAGDGDAETVIGGNAADYSDAETVIGAVARNIADDSKAAAVVATPAHDTFDNGDAETVIGAVARDVANRAANSFSDFTTGDPDNAEAATVIGAIPGGRPAPQASAPRADIPVAKREARAALSGVVRPMAARPSRQADIPSPPKPRSRLKPAYLVGAAAAVLLVVGVVFVAGIPGTPEKQADGPDQQAWEQADRDNVIPAFDTYLQTNPQGAYVQKAQDRIKAIRADIDSAWKAAQAADTPAAYDEFLEKYRRNNALVSEAESAREHAKLDESEWQRSEDQQTISSYQQYLYSPSSGKHRSDAEQRIVELSAQAEKKEDEDGMSAISTPALAPCQTYLINYPDGQHVKECQQHITQVRQVAAQIKTYQQSLIDLGLYQGPANGVMTNATTAAMKAFQAKGGLPQTAAFDASTMAALDKAVAELESSYRQARDKHTSRDYAAFLQKYPSTRYSQDAKNRASQCKNETRTDAPKVSTIVREVRERNGNEERACATAKRNVEDQAQRACAAGGGRPVGSVAAQTHLDNDSTLLGRIFSGYQCVGRIELQCQTQGPAVSQEVCP